MKRSEDNGETWSELRVLYSNSTANVTNVVGNAAPVQDSFNGRIWIPFCINNEIVYITYSDDDGLTFSEPVYYPNLVHSDWKWIGKPFSNFCHFMLCVGGVLCLFRLFAVLIRRLYDIRTLFHVLTGVDLFGIFFWS